MSLLKGSNSTYTTHSAKDERACPAAERRKAMESQCGGKGLALFIPMFQSGHSPCLPFL